jgi:ATP-dependent 26S proteasome regulatory subunit
MSEVITKSAKTAADVSALLRARNPLLWIKTAEEARVEGFLAEAAAAASYEIRFWDVGAGVSLLNGKAENVSLADIADLLPAIQARAETGIPGKKECRTVWVLRDPGIWLDGLSGARPTRQLRNLARFLPGSPPETSQLIIVLSGDGGAVPKSLASQTTVIDWPLPERSEIADTLDAAIRALPEKTKKGEPLREAATPDAATRDAAIDAAVGLTQEEAASCFAKSLVQLRKIDVKVISDEKKRVIARDGALEWLDPLPDGLDGVGGLDGLKEWLAERQLAYSPKARKYGLRSPKGVFLFGISGCGKTLTAKALATGWNVPLIKLDLGALKGKFVGESEGNIRKNLKVIEAMGRCVVLIDEVEKALQGATGGAADGGVSADALSVLLGWMQDRTSEAFVVATANDVEQITRANPEFIRKGRWDEVFFIDLPNSAEREGVLRAALRANNRDADLIDVDVEAVAKACADFSGAEIAEIVPAAMFKAFADGEREIATDDLLKVADDVIPLSKTAEAKLKALRDFASTNARKATKAEVLVESRTKGRQIEVA